MTPTQLATILGIDRKTIITYLSGSSIKQAHIKRLYNFALNFTPDEFIEIENKARDKEPIQLIIDDILEEYIDESRLSLISGYTKNTLRVWRSKKTGPPFIKVETISGRGVVRYKVDDVKRWLIEKNTAKNK